MILLCIKPPPPYGGGEIRAAALRDFVQSDAEFMVLELGSRTRNKSTQGRFAFWKVTEFLTDWRTIYLALRNHRPSLAFFPLSKALIPFLRDSVFIWTAKAHGVPVVSELAGASFRFLERRGISRWYGRLVLRQLTCLRVLGQHVAQNLAGIGICNTIVSDNGIESGFDPDYSRGPDPPLSIVFIGTHSPQKGFDNLIKACITLLNRGLLFRVHCMGEWISDVFQERAMKQLYSGGIEASFTFHGLTHGADKWRVLQSCDFLVLPSLTEGQPLSILEAYACGLPVITTDVGAVPDTVTDGANGFLIPPGDNNTLTRTMTVLLSDAALRETMSRANTTLFESRFTLHRFLTTQVSWLRDCASKRLRAQGQIYRIATDEVEH